MANKGSTGIPSLPRPPRDEITVAYMNQLIGVLEFMIEILQNEGPEQASALNLTRLQGNPGGLRVGDVFEEAGFLRIIKLNAALAGTNVGTGAVGTVTVTTT